MMALAAVAGEELIGAVAALPEREMTAFLARAATTLATCFRFDSNCDAGHTIEPNWLER